LSSTNTLAYFAAARVMKKIYFFIKLTPDVVVEAGGKGFASVMVAPRIQSGQTSQKTCFSKKRNIIQLFLLESLFS
jgi:hypothetical protein